MCQDMTYKLSYKSTPLNLTHKCHRYVSKIYRFKAKYNEKVFDFEKQYKFSCVHKHKHDSNLVTDMQESNVHHKQSVDEYKSLKYLP